MRCINLDWLEVYALEPLQVPHDAAFFIGSGWWVERREYGTRVYSEMFTLVDEHGFKVIEVRRAPCSSWLSNGVLPPNACHIRLTNRACYFNDAAVYMQKFLQQYGYTFQRISRVDICLDFEKFDLGDNPQRFLFRYMKGRYSKINQAKLHAHGEDLWTRRQWESLSWGSQKSPISTKFYNKTKELEEVKDKPYIRWCWYLAGLTDSPYSVIKKDENGDEYKPDIWRVEFSIKSDVKKWVIIAKDGNEKNKHSVKNTLDMYDSKEKLLVMFACLQQHYFHFKKLVEGKTKYECPDKTLFLFNNIQKCISPEHTASDTPENTFEKRLKKYLQKYKLIHPGADLQDAVSLIINKIDEDDHERMLDNPFNRVLKKAIQMTIALKAQGDQRDPADLILKLIEEQKEQRIF